MVRSTYAYYESDKTYPDICTVEQLAVLFGVSTDYLLTGRETVPSIKPVYPIPLEPEPNVPDKADRWLLGAYERRLVKAYRSLPWIYQRHLLLQAEKMALEHMG